MKPFAASEEISVWDVFICHASEDKESVASPLAYALSEAGLRVWYDEFALTLGDSLRQSIDRGLADSKFGIVVLSSNFFKKSWPQRELDGLTAKEVSSGKTILPIWHGVTREQVERFSPPLADKVAVSTSNGLDSVVSAVRQAVQPRRPPQGGETSRSKRELESRHNADLGSSDVGFNLVEFKDLVDFASSYNGLNLPGKTEAAQWAEEHLELFSRLDFEKFVELKDYALSYNGLNLPGKVEAAQWAEEHLELFSRLDFEKFVELKNYALSYNGLNLSSKVEAAEWALSKLC
jgi:hypothetical protein